tara:strand:- start:237 stop:608 length:372 start_codon:yes stop_codon:yes gene_type:complete
MAQNFRRYKMRDVGTSAQDAPDGVDFSTYDTIVGIHCANRATNAIKVDVFITDYNDDNDDDPSDNTANTYYLVKDAPIPSGGALQILDGGAKLVVEDGDRLWVKSDTNNSLDAWVSTVKDISN